MRVDRCAHCGRDVDQDLAPTRTRYGWACTATCVARLKEREEDEHVTMGDVAALSAKLGHRVTGEDVANYRKGLRRGELIVPLRREP